ncbi:hypothetical protein J2J97_32110 (plasmid) [Rhizobium bangladeshense]|uniref:hypothetical protein n=1 Tax=Rhizobium bangladeshense TaxID=1138189 RepID=UPI001A983480|nr:hypothetical protein [Rhizobium bangladeshense]QSY98551.1 hypothetical protein J2J97_32110 [Rhizobium bangladeshense]
MSHVTNYTIFLTVMNTMDGPDDENHLPPIMQRINARLPERQKFDNLDRNAGGYKNMECGVFGIGGNYLPFDVVRAAILPEIATMDHDGFLLVVLGQHDSAFSTYTIAQLQAETEGRW